MIIKEATRQHIHDIYELYMEAFPEDERKPFALIEEKVKEGTMEILAIEENEMFIGLAITILHKDMVLIDYFAIDATKRGKQYGSMAIELLKERYEMQRMFLEIEVLDKSADNYLDRVRRKRFYMSHGLKEAKIYASLFGVPVELLVASQPVSFEEYHSIFTDIFSEAMAKKVYQIDNTWE